MTTTTLTLDNGLRVVVETRPGAPVTATYLRFETGSASETDAESGMAHFLEHMVFKGTRTRGVGAVAADIESLGGDLNAWTSKDHTVLHATVQSENWKEALDVLADMATGSVFDPEEFERERIVVLEEVRLADSDPDSVLADRLALQLYPGHPLGRPILGQRATVAAITRDQMLAFWRRGWSPSRAVLSICGAVTADQALEAVQERLGTWTSSSALAVEPPLPESIPGTFQIPGFETQLVELDFRVPGVDHPDLPALDVLIAALGQGQSALLSASLQRDQELVLETTASLHANRDHGLVSVLCLPRDGRLDEALDETLDLIAEIARNGVDGLVVDRARSWVLADFLFSSETVDGAASENATWVAEHGSVEAREVWRRRVAQVTADDVARAAATWLRADRATIGIVGTSKKKKAQPKPKVTPRSPQKGIVRETLAGGLTAIVVDDGSSVAAVRILGMGGGLLEGPDCSGLGEAWTDSLLSGAAEHDAQGQSEALDQIAGAVEGAVGRSHMGLVGTFPAPYLGEGLRLMGNILVDPHFDAKEFRRIKGELKDDLATLPDRPSEVARRLFSEKLWGAHPWATPASGTARGLKGLTRAAVREAHDALMTPDNLVVAVVGGCRTGAVLDRLSELADELPKGPHILAARPDPGPVAVGQYRAEAGHEEAWIYFGSRAFSFRDKRSDALELATAILGAQGGRLFVELREKHSFAYSVWATHFAGTDGGEWLAGLATDPGKVNEARQLLLDTVWALAETPPTAEELGRARRMLLGQAAMGLQSTAARAGDLAMSTRFQIRSGVEGLREALVPVTPEAASEALKIALRSGVVEVIVQPPAKTRRQQAN